MAGGAGRGENLSAVDGDGFSIASGLLRRDRQ